MYRRLALISAACAALALTACGSDQDDNPVTTEFVTVEKETPAASSEASATDDRDDQDDTPAAATTDGALAAIQDALAAHPEGIVTDVDREGDSYEIDLVEGEDHVELTVDAKGKVTETERESDDAADDIAEAKAATVTALEAAQQALDAHEGGVIDSLSLDEEDGSLEWDIDLDDADGNDLAEMKVAAV
ncbi:PepSY domain-containing protein [Corynebacterium mastitidis]